MSTEFLVLPYKLKWKNRNSAWELCKKLTKQQLLMKNPNLLIASSSKRSEEPTKAKNQRAYEWAASEERLRVFSSALKEKNSGYSDILHAYNCYLLGVYWECLMSYIYEYMNIFWDSRQNPHGITCAVVKITVFYRNQSWFAVCCVKKKSYGAFQNQYRTSNV